MHYIKVKSDKKSSAAKVVRLLHTMPELCALCSPKVSQSSNALLDYKCILVLHRISMDIACYFSGSEFRALTALVEDWGSTSSQ